MNNIFVGNLSFQSTKEDVTKLFEKFGTVANVVIMERKKGKSRGYGFVDMPNEEEKNAAIVALEGREFMERVLSVSPVIPKVKSEKKVKHFKSPKKEWKPQEDQSSRPESAREENSTYSKFDNSPKPWRKGSPDSKPPRQKNKGSRPYYGKKEGESHKKFEGSSKSFAKKTEGSKVFNKPSKGFKMLHKVSGASRVRSQKEQVDERRPL